MTERTRRAAVGGAAAAFWLAGATAAAPLSGGHPLFGLAQVVIDTSPGWLATFVIETFGKLAQPLLVAGMGAGVLAFGATLGAVWDRLPPAVRGWWFVAGGLLAVTAGTHVLAGVTSVTTLGAATLLAAGPAAGFLVLAARRPAGRAVPAGRRPVLQGVGVALAGAAGIGAVARTVTPEEGTDDTEPLPGNTDTPDGTGNSTDEPDPVTATAKRQDGTTVTATVTPTPTATPEVLRKERIGEVTVTEIEGAGQFGFDFTGMPRAVTPADGHYVIDKNVDDPDVDASRWTLSVGGPAAEESFELSFDDLTGHEESRDQVVTMVCISNLVGEGLISTGRWRGIPLASLVERAGPTDDAVDIVTEAADGYTEGIPWEYVRDHPEVLLAYGLDGQTLPTEHGAPARLLIPGRYGMKSTKWVTGIEVSDADHQGYWDERGWDEEAVVKTLSYIRAAQRRGDRIAVGGVAYAGLDGVRSVEVSLDGGETWTEADLEDPPGEHAWRRWRYVVERPPGELEVVPRAIDDTGTRQTSEETPPHEGAGATGWHRESFDL